MGLSDWWWFGSRWEWKFGCGRLMNDGDKEECERGGGVLEVVVWLWL